MSDRARRDALIGALMVLGAALLWGSLGLFAKVLYVRGFTPVELASIRAAVGFATLGVWLAALRQPLGIAARELPFFAAFGIVAFALFEFLYFATVERTTLGVAVALLYTAPAFVLLLSRLLGDERIGAPQLAALVLVLSGVFLVTGALRTFARGEAALTGTALLLGLGSGLTYGLYTIFGRHALRRHAPLPTLFYVLGFAALALAFAAPPWQGMIRDPGAIPLLLAIGIFPTVVAYLLYLNGLQRLRATTASMLAAIEPVVAAGLGAAFLGERLGVDQSIGVLLVLTATILLATRAD